MSIKVIFYLYLRRCIVCISEVVLSRVEGIEAYPPFTLIFTQGGDVIDGIIFLSFIFI